MNNNYGIVRIFTGFRNTVIVATDAFGNVIAWDSAAFNYRTPELSELSYNSSKAIATKLKEQGIDIVDVVVKGPGTGRKPALKALIDNGITINMIKDKTPIPHNGIVPLSRKRKMSKTL